MKIRRDKAVSPREAREYSRAVGITEMRQKAQAKDIRLLLGFVLAPAVVPAASVLCGWGFVRHYAGTGADVDSLAPFVRFSFRIELPAAYFLTVLFAVPYVLSMRERGVLDFWTLMTPLTVVASITPPVPPSES